MRFSLKRPTLMPEPAKKKVRVADFGRKSHVSAAALSSLLAQVREEGLPDAFSRRTQYRERAAITNAQTSFGPLLQCTDVVTTHGKMKVFMQESAAPLGNS